MTLDVASTPAGALNMNARHESHDAVVSDADERDQDRATAVSRGAERTYRSYYNVRGRVELLSKVARPVSRRADIADSIPL